MKTYLNTIFVNGRADYGGAIYSYDTNYYASNWFFFNNTANAEGGAYYVILSRNFKIERNLFQENSANLGEGISMRNINKYLEIINWNFTSSFPSQFIYADFASMTITHSEFSNNVPSSQNIESFNLRDGGAIKISTTVRMDLISNTFKNIISNNGAISLTLSDTGVTLSDLFPYLYRDSDTQLVNIINNTFKGMKSYGENGGSCINFEWAVIGCQLNLGDSTSNTKNMFENSYSNTTGGAIMYSFYKPSGIDLKSFINNSAYQYASDISSPPQKLLIVSKKFYEENINSIGDSKNVSIGNSLPGNTILKQRSGGIIDEFYIGIFNEFDILDKSITGGNLIASISHKKEDKYLSSINKASVFVSQNGLFNITNMEVIATPNSVQTITFLTNVIDSTIPSNIAYYSSINQTDSRLLVTVNFRECISGEEFKNNGEWSEWEPGKYLIDAATNETQWKECPISKANWTGGNKIYPLSGYWRYSNTSADILKWFVASSWEGYTIENNNELGACSTGYIGTMCANWDVGYSHTGDFICGKWPNKGLGIFFIFLFAVIFIAVISVIIIFTIGSVNSRMSKNEELDLQSQSNEENINLNQIKIDVKTYSSTRSDIGIYIKILMNHTQFIFIIEGIRINWPSAFDTIFQISRKIGEPEQQLFSLDCFLDRRTEDNLNANSYSLFFLRVILACSLPIVWIIWVCWFWLMKYLIQKNCLLNKNDPTRRINTSRIREKIKDNNISGTIASLIISLMYIHPTVFTVNMEMFNCVDVNGSKRLSKDIDTLWFNGRYFYFFPFSIVVILIFCFGVPFVIWNRLKSNSKHLYDYQTEKRYGFLYKGYRPRYYWWETVIIFRKMFIVFMITVGSLFGTSIQWFVIFVGLTAFIIFHVVFSPFLKRELNSLETFSMSTILLLVYCAVFLSSQSINASGSNKTKRNFVLDDATIQIVENIIIWTIIVFYVYFGIYFAIYKKETPVFPTERQTGWNLDCGFDSHR